MNNTTTSLRLHSGPTARSSLVFSVAFSIWLWSSPTGPVRAEPLQPVLERLPATLLSVSGTTVGGEDAVRVYAVGGDPEDGRGPLILRYDGSRWHRIPTDASGALWWISDRPIDGRFYLVGADGLALRLDPASQEVERLAAPGEPFLYGVWGTDAEHVWAVGGEFSSDVDGQGVVWFDDGTGFQPIAAAEDAVPEGLPTLYKVWGRSSEDVYAVGRRGVVLHFDGAEWTQIASPTDQPLFTIHGNSTQITATGGFVDGVILEPDGPAFVDRTPPACLQVNGVFLSESGPAVAVGIQGTFASREEGTWQLESPLQADGARDLHAAWVDAAGGVWAVGGDLSVFLAEGVLAYAGPAAIGTEFVTNFRRGDANADGAYNISDPVAVLSYLFGPGAAPPCLDSADVDDDGQLQINDPIYALNHLFSNGATPPEPFASCGPDQEGDALGCERFAPCTT